MNSLANLQKTELRRCFLNGGVAAFARLCVILFSSSLAAQAPDPHFQNNWSPNNYKIVCKPLKPCNFDEEASASIEKLLAVAVEDISRLSFRAPRWWAPRKTSGAEGREYIELKGSDNNFVAFVSCQYYGEKAGPIEQAIMNIGKRFRYFRDYDAEYWNYNFVNHEVFHLVQYEYPFWDASTCGNNVPGWVMESTATAFATQMMRVKYPSVWPSKRNEGEARDFAGLRRYDQPLPLRIFNDEGEVRSGRDIYQRVSSFWRHLADTHHAGKYDFLANYMMSTAVGDDWVSWLRNNVQKYSGADLGMVFGGFLGDFAGWSEKGYPGEIFSRKKWLQEAFDGCETIYLNREEPVDYVEVDLLPLSGDCVEVTMAAMGPNGIAEGESAAVQIAAMIMTGPSSSRGGLHLALAASNDKTGFLCAREVKRHRKKGVGKCLFNPDDGKIRFNGGWVNARLWNVIAQQKGDSKEMRQEEDTESSNAELKNLYTIAYTPTLISMRDAGYDNTAPVTIRLYFILDIAKIDIEGNKKGAVGTFAEGADPQTTLPKVDSSGKPVNSFSKPDQLQPVLPAPPPVPPQSIGKLGSIIVGTAAENAEPPYSTIALLPGKESTDGKIEAYALSVGETGVFPVSVSGSLNGEPVVNVNLGSLDVQEFTDLVFRARFNAVVCRHRDLQTDKAAQQDPCRNPVPVSGDIVKAFAGSRLPGYHMVAERTEGTEIYRKANEQGMAAWSLPPAETGSTGETGAPPPLGSVGSTANTLPDCSCTCEERAETIKQGEDFKARQAAGEAVGAGMIMGLMRCNQQCQSEYMMCVMAENQEQEALEKAAEAAGEEKLAKECDCSCAALNSFQTRTEELLQAVQGGSPTAMDEMQRLGNCISVCQDAIFTCAQSN